MLPLDRMQDLQLTLTLLQHLSREKEFFIDNLPVQIHSVIVMIRWTGLAPWEFESPFPGSLTSTFLERMQDIQLTRGFLQHLSTYRGTSFIRKRTPLGPYRRPMTRVLGGS